MQFLRREWGTLKTFEGHVPMRRGKKKRVKPKRQGKEEEGAKTEEMDKLKKKKRARGKEKRRGSLEGEERGGMGEKMCKKGKRQKIKWGKRANREKKKKKGEKEGYKRKERQGK